MSRLATEFLTGCAGAVHLTAFLPDGAARAAVVVAQPFAEEANKSRRMVALSGRAMAQRGMAVYVLDAYGCGDSAGDFSQASWPVWRQDLQMTARLAAERHQAPVVMMGVRLGALLAADALGGLEDVSKVVLWQPAVSGAQLLTQFLRLRTAATMTGSHKESVADLKQRLASGEHVEVAGYSVSPGLATAVEAATLKEPPARASAMGVWFWLTGTDTVPLPLSAARDGWQQAGWHTEMELLAGDAFWATQEIATVPELVERTASAVDGMLQ